ncbi:MAG: YggS family pyridoxal phosphate-dependent enzyme [Ruminococcaceae bacterium]|nr:YggS family pyridoxal phosphate-dependent enzyme [Oscillospiraceae bacterium]
MDFSYMDRNFAAVREKMQASCEKSGNPEPLLVAAVKYTDAVHIDYLTGTLGVKNIGENRVQQLLEHWETIRREGVSFHFIGTLQSNKVKYIIDKVTLIHSVDSLSLAKEIDRQAAKHGIRMDILCEINSGREPNKSGVMPEDAAALCEEIAKLPHLRLRGFMTMAPHADNPEDARKFFRETFRRGLDIWQKKLHNIDRPVFSMGMSESFPVAIEEGATIVRVGRSLFREPENTDEERK